MIPKTIDKSLPKTSANHTPRCLLHEYRSGVLSPIGIQVGQQTAKLGIVAQQLAPGLDQAVHLLVFEMETGGDLIEIFRTAGSGLES
jgi:hypothetical protein